MSINLIHFALLSSSADVNHTFSSTILLISRCISLYLYQDPNWKSRSMFYVASKSLLIILALSFFMFIYI